MLDTVIHGDCLEVLRHLQTNSIDSCVTDPPYGLGEVKDFSGLLLSWLRGEDGTEHAQKFGFMSRKERLMDNELEQLKKLLDSAFFLVTYAVEMLREHGIETAELERMVEEHEAKLALSEFGADA